MRIYTVSSPTSEHQSYCNLATMDVVGYITFLADSPLWETEKPFGLTLPADYDPPEGMRLTNLKFAERRLDIHDMRSCISPISVDLSGFTLLQQPTEYLEITNMDIFEAYKRETESVLRELFKPDFIRCWDGRVSGILAIGMALCLTLT
jgi:hypothetical protein